MPGGNQSTTGSSSQTTSVAAPTAVNPGLNNLYNSIFGGGAAGTAVSTLQGIQSGKSLTDNISQIYQSLNVNSQGAYQQGIGAIKAAAGASGNALSSSTGAQIGSYANNYIQNLNTTATNMGLQQENMQLSAANPFLSLLGQSANQYYTPTTTTSGSQKGNTSLPWNTTLTSIASLFA